MLEPPAWTCVGRQSCNILGCMYGLAWVGCQPYHLLGCMGLHGPSILSCYELGIMHGFSELQEI